MTQKYKLTDEVEGKVFNAGVAAPNKTEVDLGEMYEGCYLAIPFVLAMFDDGRYPFSAKIPREAFPAFIQEAFNRFPVFGTFDCYLFIIESIFGPLTEIFFEVPAPGKLSIEVNASSSLEFDFIAREFIDGAYVFYDIVDDVGDTIVFRGIAGIENEAQLKLLFSEIMPNGIVPDITLTFLSRSDFIGEDPGGEFFVITDIGDQIVFVEIGG